MDCTQTKNQVTEFNEGMVRACNNSEIILHAKGFHMSFLICANDGVSCDSEIFQVTLNKFIVGKNVCISLTDANHNLKNVHYKLIVRGISMRVYGILVIDRGLLLKSDTAQDLWRANYFASDLIVLQLGSADSVSKTIAFEHDEQDSTLDLFILLL